MDIDIQPEKGWKTEDIFVPPGFHIDAEITGEDERPEGEAGEQPYIYPMGVGGILMNGCFGTNYQPGDPCYEAFWKTTLCHVSARSMLVILGYIHFFVYSLGSSTTIALCKVC